MWVYHTTHKDNEPPNWLFDPACGWVERVWGCEAFGLIGFRGSGLRSYGSEGSEDLGFKGLSG